MSTQSSTVEYITDQLASVSDITSRKMFGEYAIYASGKVVALVCDDMLFVKITPEGKVYAGSKYEEGAPYPGAKPWILIDSDLLEDRDWISTLIKITEENLPEPKPKKKK